MNCKKRFLSLLVLVLILIFFVGGATAATYSGSCGAGLTWTLTTETGVLEITGSGDMTDYSSNKRPGWYMYKDNITTVSLSSGVTSIGGSAFSGCSSLTSVVIPDSVTSIGYQAFYGCSSLTSVVIPDSVTSIGTGAFSGCHSLTSITLGKSVTSIESSTFKGCTSLTSVIIPDSVTSIGERAFSDCTSLTTVKIGNSVTSIKQVVFFGCSNLEVVDMSNTTALSSIENSAFGSNSYSAMKSDSVIYVSDKPTAALFIDEINYYAPNTRIIVGKPVPEITYIIKYDADGGTGNMNDQLFTYNKTQNLSSNTFVKEASVFSGWAATAEGSVIYTDNQSVRNLLDIDGASLILYAVWKKDENPNTPISSLPLIKGWNFISVPKTLNQTANTAGSLFGSVDTDDKNILGYDPIRKSWVPLRAADIIQPLDGYWIYAATKATVPLTYPSMPTPPSVKTLYPGWNAVGLSSLANTPAQSALNGTFWRVLIPWNLEGKQYDPAIINGGSEPNNPSRLMTLGNGYWLYVDAESTLIGLTA
ncbi:MAG TPA: leucine-rich repeat protein [Methanocorpusculum sp.]|nr:leucine-rich repeat protein [Methanocorpusculum sp.]